VLLDKDLAFLYGVETKRLNEVVKRNTERFPKDFMVQLAKEESLRSQITTLKTENSNSRSNRGGTRCLPYAFTENGAAMLSSVLRSETAIEANIRIMRVFTTMRRFSLPMCKCSGISAGRTTASSALTKRSVTLGHHSKMKHLTKEEIAGKIDSLLQSGYKLRK